MISTFILSLLFFCFCPLFTGSCPAEAVYEENTADDAYWIIGQIEADVKGRTCPFLKDYGNGVEEDEFTLYFVGDGDIPYVSLEDYFALLTEVNSRRGMGEVCYECSHPEDTHIYPVVRNDNHSLMVVDTELDTIDFLDFNLFTQKPGVSALVTIMDLPEPEHFNPGDTEMLFQTAASSYNRYGSPVHLTLSAYLIDIVEKDNVCYVPMQTLNDIFMGTLYMHFIFNGEKLFGFTYGSSLADSAYEAAPEEMSWPFADYNYQELRFLLDNFYGLKKEHGITDFGSLVVKNPDLDSKLSGIDPAGFDSGVSRLTGTYLDDGHSGFISSSWRAGKDDYSAAFSRANDLGVSTMSLIELSTKFRKARRDVFPYGVPAYQEIGDTAFVTIDSFAAYSEPAKYYQDDTTDYSRFLLDWAGKQAPDTIKLCIYAHKMISREESPIKNVVIDLSNNGGGDANAAIFVISWLLGRADIALRDTFTGAETIMSFRADVSLDNRYETSLFDRTLTPDSLRELGVNTYCLISPASFSSGNLVPAACKISREVTVIGQTSGGGSCVILPCTSASGTVFQISGPKQLAIVKNGSFYNIDEGIEPDVILTKAQSFYDREALAEYISQLR